MFTNSRPFSEKKKEKLLYNKSTKRTQCFRYVHKHDTQTLKQCLSRKWSMLHTVCENLPQLCTRPSEAEAQGRGHVQAPDADTP